MKKAGRPILVFFVMAMGILPGRIFAQPVITQQPTNAVVDVGQSAGVSVTCTGDGLAYQWFKDGVMQVGQPAQQELTWQWP